MNMRTKATEIKPIIIASPLPGYEYGCGIMALSFTSGHVLALREFPEIDFAPFWAVWQHTPLVLHIIEKIGNLLFDVGAINLSGHFSDVHFAIHMPRLMFFIATSVVRHNGICLRASTHSNENPTIGNLKFSARAIFAIGGYYFQIQDQEAYQWMLTELDIHILQL